MRHKVLDSEVPPNSKRKYYTIFQFSQVQRDNKTDNKTGTTLLRDVLSSRLVLLSYPIQPKGEMKKKKKIRMTVKSTEVLIGLDRSTFYIFTTNCCLGPLKSQLFLGYHGTSTRPLRTTQHTWKAAADVPDLSPCK